MDLTGNTILVTGGGSGIGAALAGALHDMGNRVIVAGRRPDALRDVARRHPGIECLRLDQADPASVAAVAAEVARRWPALNVLINNAGIVAVEDLAAPDPETISAVCSTNLIGPLQLTAHLLPVLRGRPRAAIVNVSSALAFVPLAALPTYSAAKAALHSYTESLRFQLRDSLIQVIELPPPRVYTSAAETRDGAGVELADFVAETMALLAAYPDADEIVVASAQRLRYADRRGDYEDVYAAVNPTTQSHH